MMNGGIISSLKDKTLPQLFVVMEVIYEKFGSASVMHGGVVAEFCNILVKQIILFEFISV